MILELTALAILAAFPGTIDAAGAVDQPTPARSVEWVHDFDQARSAARAADKMILAYFWSDGSEYCAKLYQETLGADEVAAPLGGFVCLSVQHSQDGSQDLFDRFAVHTLPTMIFLDAEGNPEDLIQGFIPVRDFLYELQRIRSGEGTLSGMRAVIEKARKNSEEDLGTRLALAGKLIDLGEQETHDRILDSIRADDRTGRTVTGARLLLGDIERQVVEDGGRDESPQNWDLEPLYAHARAVRPKEARFEAWNRIANLEIYRQHMGPAFDAFRTAWKLVPEEQALDWSGHGASWIIENAEGRTSVEKKFALDLAVAAHRLMEKHVEEVEERDALLAGSLHRLAWAHFINGNGAKAISTVKQCLELADRDEFRATLETFTQGF